ncbi:MAG TPA: hypothetical protein VL689_22505 [Paraburkholderia sp.]|jgi:hypothetical protein|nr:hypothetical protein [Paraburkholderia sp.]
MSVTIAPIAGRRDRASRRPASRFVFPASCRRDDTFMPRPVTDLSTPGRFSADVRFLHSIRSLIHCKKNRQGVFEVNYKISLAATAVAAT